MFFKESVVKAYKKVPVNFLLGHAIYLMNIFHPIFSLYEVLLSLMGAFEYQANFGGIEVPTKAVCSVCRPAKKNSMEIMLTENAI